MEGKGVQYAFMVGLGVFGYAGVYVLFRIVFF
jgi:hypothetical protein